MVITGRRAIAGLVAGVAIVVLVAVVSIAEVDRAEACSVVRPTGEFTGTATQKEGDSVTFDVDEVTDWNPSSSASRPADGAQVRVAYSSGTSSYLRVGQKYRVAVLGPGADGAFESFVARASSGCSGSMTVYADGHTIDTSLISFRGLHTGALVAIGAGIVAAGAAGVIIGRSMWRRRSRIADPTAV